MSIRDRRNSVLKSSISINAIGDSITNCTSVAAGSDNVFAGP